MIHVTTRLSHWLDYTLIPMHALPATTLPNHYLIPTQADPGHDFFDSQVTRMVTRK